MGISSGRIIDNAGRRRLPIGIEDFERVIRDFTYVDKSLLVRDLVDSNFNAVLFCRPRRFGKSLAMRMLQSYFEAPAPGGPGAEAGGPGAPDPAPAGPDPAPGAPGPFAGLAISEAGERYERERGAHPAVFLSLSECAARTWDLTRSLLGAAMAAECIRHDYLLDSAALKDDEKDALRRLMSKQSLPGELEGSLAFLSRMLARHHGAGTVILIDEYDAPVTKGYLNGYLDEAVDFYRVWLTGALKATTSLYLGVMTGVQRVSRESIFSGLNNIVVDTALDHRFTEAFGFTEDEAGELAAFCGRAGAVPEMRDWYDGYVFGSERVYNPWSVLNFLADGGAAQPYWGNTSSNAVVHDLFSQAEGAAAGELAQLAAGGTVSEPIDLATVFDMVGRDPQAIWSQLYLAGYLTTDDTAEPNNAMAKRELRVPNREVGLLYRSEFADRSEAIAGNRSRLYDLHDALRAGDAPALESALRRILLDSPSALDLVRENSYHMLLVGLLYYVYGYRFPASNREAGDGRADIVLAPERENAGRLPGIVVEVKWSRGRPSAAPAGAAGPAGTALTGAAQSSAAPSVAGGSAGVNTGVPAGMIPAGAAPAVAAGPFDDAALGALADAAPAQVGSRSYADALPPGPVLEWGVAFSGKRVAARCRSAG